MQDLLRAVAGANHIRALEDSEMAEKGDKRVFDERAEIAAFFGTKPVDFGAKAVYFVAAHAVQRQNQFDLRLTKLNLRLTQFDLWQIQFDLRLTRFDLRLIKFVFWLSQLTFWLGNAVFRTVRME